MKAKKTPARLILPAILILAAFFAGLSAAQEKRPVSPGDLVALRAAGGLNVSPDGKTIAFTVEEPACPENPAQPGDVNIWVVPSDGSEPPRLFAASPKNDSQPRFSPDGRWLAFLSNRGNPREGEKEASNQVYLIRRDGGEAEPLTSVDGEVELFRWSPDGKSIAFTLRDPKTPEERKKEKAQDDAVRVDRDYRFARLWVIEVTTRTAFRLTEQAFHVADFAWSPGGTEIALVVSPTPRLDDVFWRSKLVIADSMTGQVVRTLSEKVSGSPRWSPDGSSLTMLEYTPLRIADLPAVVPSEGGPSRIVLDAYAGTVLGLEWPSDPKRLLVQSLEGTKMSLSSLELETGRMTRLADVQASGASFDTSRDGTTIAYLQESQDSPADVWCLKTGAEPKRLTTLNPQVASLRLGEVKEVSWKNKKDGRTVYGVLITPPGFEQGRLYPTVVQVHGGPRWAWWSGWHGSWHEWGQLLASNGYVVLLPNPRGSDGQGWRFAEANLEDWGGMDFKDILAGVDWLVEGKIADPDRLGIGGWSYGGFMTSWAVGQTNRFKAAVVGAAVTDLFSFHGTTDITPNFLYAYFRDIPYRRRPVYEAHTPMAFVENVKTPCLVLHGERDQRVPPGQGWEFYSALKQLGVPVEMVTYPRETHGIRERAHQRDLLERILAWYNGYLKK